MTSSFDRYVSEIGRLRLRPGRAPENLVVLPVVDSTNRIARAIVQEYETEEQPLPPLLILALEQSGGRGRQGKSWSSPAGKGVYATRVLTVPDPAVLQTLPLLVGVGLSRALDPFLPSSCRLKWPNDLLAEGRKIGGILIEAMVHTEGESRALIGFGVNVGHEREELPETGTSLHLMGSGSSLEELTWKLVEGLERELEHLGDLAYAAEAYRELSAHRSGDRISCRVGDSTVEGTFVAIDDLGRLVLDNGGEELRLSSGEVIG
ncbi:MAG TPA: biotin--[acetyl-CoA-carboxylase] ligase [Thermoanaerobaculia bacterium]|nr:biotin--[acetyl-CoA-carboxylase] ligase [Thermoanaerobaculia bacterium]